MFSAATKAGADAGGGRVEGDAGEMAAVDVDVMVEMVVGREDVIAAASVYEFGRLECSVIFESKTSAMSSRRHAEASSLGIR